MLAGGVVIFEIHEGKTSVGNTSVIQRIVQKYVTESRKSKVMFVVN